MGENQDSSYFGYSAVLSNNKQVCFKIELKGMTKNHDFSYSLPLYFFPPKKREEENKNE